MTKNISNKSSEGYGNTFLHILGQAIITTLRGRNTAEVAGDIHEREQESLVTGAITPSEERDAIDNYVDLVNNIYGQELGEQLKS